MASKKKKKKKKVDVKKWSLRGPDRGRQNDARGGGTLPRFATALCFIQFMVLHENCVTNLTTFDGNIYCRLDNVSNLRNHLLAMYWYVGRGEFLLNKLLFFCHSLWRASRALPKFELYAGKSGCHSITDSSEDHSFHQTSFNFCSIIQHLGCYLLVF